MTIIQMMLNRISTTPLKSFANPALWCIGLIGGFLSYMLGGWDVTIQTLMLFVVVDYITGVAAGVKEEGWDSKIGKRGVAGKALILIVICISVQIDRLFATSITRTVFIYFYIANELGSIIENLGRLEFPLPPMIKDVMKILRNKGGENIEEIPFSDTDRENYE